MKIALYARVSTGRQEHEQTIESQVEALRAHARDQGHELEEKHIYLDEGVSGTRMDRPGLDRLRDAARDGEFQGILVYDFDRLARRFVYQEVLREEFQRLGVELISLKTRGGETPEDHLLVQMQGVFAEYERAKIFDRTRRGRLFKARQGTLLPWGVAPYGYRAVRTPDGTSRHPEILEEEAAWVRQMFSWLVDEGLTVREIAKRLNERKVPTKLGRARWRPSTVGALLHCPVYIGKQYYNRSETVESKRPRHPEQYRRHSKTKRWRPSSEWIEIPMPAVVDEETFRRAAERLRTNHSTRSGPRPEYGKYLLRTLVRCGECGLKMTCYRSNGYCYYRCLGQDRVAMGREHRCPARLVRADRLDEAVWKRLVDLIHDPPTLVSHIRGLEESYTTEQRDELAQVERLANLVQQGRRQVQRLIDAYEGGIINLAELQVRRRKIEERMTSLEQQQSAAQQRREDRQQQERLVANVEQLCDALRHGIEHSTFEDRQRVVRLLVEEVSVKHSDVVLRHVIPVQKSSAN
jgi:site-specific DNA recombinase